jgi:hypothetical protein
MTKQTASDAGIGRAVFATRLMLSLRAMSMSLLFGALPGFVLPYVSWRAGATEHEVDIVRIALIAKFSDDATASRWEMRDASGEYRVVEALLDNGKSAAQLRPAEVRRALSAEWGAYRTFTFYALLSLILPVVGYLVVWFLLIRLGRSNMEDKRVRGADEIITVKRLNSMVRARDASDYRLAEVALPKMAPMQGILALGAQGTGKSLVIHDLMQQVFARGRKCFIYDQSGEFFRAYYRPGKDFFFNPACEGSVPWSIFSELKYVYDADAMAQAFLPPKAGVVHGSNAFFEDAARALFSVMLARLAGYGAINTSDLAKAIFEMPDDEMDRLIEKSVASSAVGGDSKGQRQGVISSIAIYLAGIQAVQPGCWSVRDFLEADDDARFFILGTDDTKAMFTPLYRLLLTASFAMIAAKQEIVHEDKYWFFLDEVLTLGDIKLDEALATLRKFGVAVVSGLQSESQVVASVGQERSETIMNCFNTVLTLRLNDSGMQERAAKRLGKVEMETVSQNQALAVTEARDGAGVNIADQEKWLVMPSEIGALESCTGFLKLAGGYPAARVDYRSWLPSRRGASSYVDRFAPVQDSPPRDPRFNLARRFEAGSVDPLVKFKEDFDAGKGGAASATSPPASQPEGSVFVDLPESSTKSPVEREESEFERLQGDDKAGTLAAFASVQVQQNEISSLLLGQVNQDQSHEVGQQREAQIRGGVVR